MIVTLLGTNGWFDTETGQTMSTLIRTNDYSIILDAGFGIRKAKALIDFSKPTYFLLSHLHLDHTAGLHLLDYLDFKLPLKFVVPSGQQEELRALVRPPYMSALPEDAEVFGTDELDKAGLPFGITTLPLCHPVPDNGFRLEIEGKTIVYLSDTGYCENAVKLAKDADLCIAECGALPGMAGPISMHMNPEICAKLAVEANVKQMVLTHFSGANYTSTADRLNAANAARSICPTLIAGFDNMEFVL